MPCMPRIKSCEALAVGKIKSIERKKGIQPSARQHLNMKRLKPNWSKRAHIDEQDETVRVKKAAFRLVVHDARKGRIAYIGSAHLKDGDGRDQKKDIGHGFSPYEMSARRFSGVCCLLIAMESLARMRN